MNSQMKEKPKAKKRGRDVECYDLSVRFYLPGTPESPVA